MRSVEDGEEVPGVIVICPLTGRQLLADRRRALRRIGQAMALARAHGAEIVGLGGLLSSVTGGGTAVNGDGPAVATGRALTPTVVTRFVVDVAAVAGLDLERKYVAIVGAGGIVGSITATLLARAGARRLRLIDLPRARHSLDSAAQKVTLVAPRCELETSHDVGLVRESPVVVVASNAGQAVIRPEHLRAGAIVVDDTFPSDLHPDVFRRRDIVVIAGGVIRTPGVRTNMRLDLRHREENYSCFGEVAALAAHGRTQARFSCGIPSTEQVDEIARMASAIGITRGRFQNPTHVYGPEEIREIVRRADP